LKLLCSSNYFIIPKKINKENNIGNGVKILDLGSIFIPYKNIKNYALFEFCYVAEYQSYRKISMFLR